MENSGGLENYHKTNTVEEHQYSQKEKISQITQDNQTSVRDSYRINTFQDRIKSGMKYRKGNRTAVKEKAES